jgi:hypothetical protein
MSCKKMFIFIKKCSHKINKTVFKIFEEKVNANNTFRNSIKKFRQFKIVLHKVQNELITYILKSSLGCSKKSYEFFSSYNSKQFLTRL